MTLWRVVRYDPHLGEQWEWYGRKLEATVAHRQASREYANCPGPAPELQRVVVPTTKAPLVAWLNRWAGDNNG